MLKLYSLEYEGNISAAHRLKMSYKDKCANLHGHNYKIKVIILTDKLNDAGMIIDFNELKEIIDQLDHKYLNDYIDNPTAECLADYLVEKILERCKNILFIKVGVRETDKAWVWCEATVGQ